MYDEFGNYIGPDMDNSSDEDVEKKDAQDDQEPKLIDTVSDPKRPIQYLRAF